MKAPIVQAILDAHQNYDAPTGSQVIVYHEGTTTPDPVMTIVSRAIMDVMVRHQTGPVDFQGALEAAREMVGGLIPLIPEARS